MDWSRLTDYEADATRCASEGCEGNPKWRLVAAAVGSSYCQECRDRIDDHLCQDDDAGECHMCGGSGILDDECECSAFEDVCCCLHPTPRECPECRYHEQQLRARQKAERAQHG